MSCHGIERESAQDHPISAIGPESIGGDVAERWGLRVPERDFD